MLQCAVASKSILSRPTFKFSYLRQAGDGAGATKADGRMDLSMCPNKYNKPMYKMALCTTSQFGNRVQHQVRTSAMHDSDDTAASVTMLCSVCVCVCECVVDAVWLLV